MSEDLVYLIHPFSCFILDDLEHGLLGERQKTWVDGFPNDPYVENPVVYK